MLWSKGSMYEHTVVPFQWMAGNPGAGEHVDLGSTIDRAFPNTEEEGHSLNSQPSRKRIHRSQASIQIGVTYLNVTLAKSSHPGPQ